MGEFTSRLRTDKGASADHPQTTTQTMSSASNERVECIRTALNDALSPESLEIVDESHLHAGHAGARDGRGHFRVHIVAAGFEGMAPLKRHRTVYAALGEMIVTTKPMVM